LDGIHEREKGYGVGYAVVGMGWAVGAYIPIPCLGLLGGNGIRFMWAGAHQLKNNKGIQYSRVFIALRSTAMLVCRRTYDGTSPYPHPLGCFNLFPPV